MSTLGRRRDVPVGVPNDARVITADGSRTCATNGSCADSRQRAHTAEVPVFSHATYHHAACSLSGGGPRVTGMYGQGAPLDCAPPPWHECASAAGCSFHASTRQACSSTLACTVWGMRWCTVAPGLATHHMHMRLSLTPSARRQCTHAPPRLASAGGRWWEREPRPPFSTPGSHSGAPRGKPRRALRPSPHARTAQLPCRELPCGRGVLTLCARAAVDGQVGSMPLVPCAPPLLDRLVGE